MTKFPLERFGRERNDLKVLLELLPEGRLGTTIMLDFYLFLNSQTSFLIRLYHFLSIPCVFCARRVYFLYAHDTQMTYSICQNAQRTTEHAAQNAIAHNAMRFTLLFISSVTNEPDMTLTTILQCLRKPY